MVAVLQDDCFRSGPVSGRLEGAVVLHAVTTEAHPGFDRVIYSFNRISSVPGLSATYAVSADAPPFTLAASGEPLAVEGRAFLRVDFLDVHSHDPRASQAAAIQRGATELDPGLGVVAEICRSDDFDGYLEWIIGLARGARWRATQLDAPTRLLVDVENKIRLVSTGRA
jgi:hypothetical protein